MELSDERLCRWNFIYLFIFFEWDGIVKLKLYLLMNFREYFLILKFDIWVCWKIWIVMDGVEFYCDENSILNY